MSKQTLSLSLSLQLTLLFCVVFNAMPVLAANQQPISAVDDYVLNELLKAGWRKNAAIAVVAVNSTWFTLLKQKHENDFYYQIKLLKQLTHSAYVSAFLRRHPETAGLLAHSDNPSLLAKTLNKPDCYNAMTRFYALHSSLLTEALDKHRDVMCDIAERGILGGEMVFIFPRHSKAAKEYDAWLEDVFSKYLWHSSDTQLAEIIAFLIERGQYIRQRLNDDPIFYKRFRRELWPAFMRVVHNKGAFDWLVNDPHIWDLLAIDKGEELLDKWGLAPVGLLFGEGSYPANMRYTIIDILLEGDDDTVDALYKYKDELLFSQLMRRRLSAGTQAALASKLATLCPNYPEQGCPDLPHHLRYFVSITDNAALAEEIGPPPTGVVTWLPFYDSYYAVKKMVQGRELTGGDAVGIGLDALAIVPVAFVAQKVSIISKPLGKTIQKFGNRSKMLSQKLDRTRQVRRVKKTKTKLPQSSFSTVLHKNQQFLNQLKQKGTKWVSYDVTKFIRFLHKKAGRRGRNTMRFFGLEARVFMRKDAKVVMNPSQGLGGHFFRETLERALNEVLGERAGYALTVLEMTPKVMSRRTGRLLAKAKKKVTAWQQNISAWWLVQS